MIRWLLLTALIWLACCSAAQAATVEQLNDHRVSLGLPALPVHEPDPAMQQIADQVLDYYAETQNAWTRDTLFEGEGQISCVCRLRDPDSEAVVDPAQLYQQRSGRLAAFAVFRSDQSLAETLWSFPWVQALLAHSGAQSLTLFAGRGASQLLVVGLDPGAPPAARATAGTKIDPESGSPPAFLFPPGKGSFALYRSVAGSSRALEARYEVDPEVSPVAVLPDGSVFLVVLEQEDFPFAWNSRYTVVRGASQSGFTTTKRPASLASGRWHYTKSIKGKYRPYRMRFQRALRSGSAAARALTRQLAARIKVSTHAGWAMSFASTADENGYYQVDYARGHLTAGRFTPHVVWHEIGHVIDFSSLDSSGIQAFRRVWKRSRHYKRCFPNWADGPRSCVSDAEIFAEQFAFWATGNSRVRSGYNVPPLIRRSRFSRLLRRWLAFRPSNAPQRLPYLNQEYEGAAVRTSGRI